MICVINNDFAIKSKYHGDLFVLSCFNSSYLEFTRCYYSEYVLCFILSNCLLVKVFYTELYYYFFSKDVQLQCCKNVTNYGIFFCRGNSYTMGN